MPYARKLIEVALPLDAINVASVDEKQPFTPRHPRSLHIWWARRPLAAARAVLFAQLVDDPSAHPKDFPTEELVLAERKRLHAIIEQLVLWENTTNENVLDAARAEIRATWRKTCAANKDHPRAAELFDADKLPAFHDPFAGGGAIPLEAQRLGLEAFASDLNPVAVLINKAMIEIPPKFAGKPPINPEARGDKQLFAREWKGARGLAEDVRYYGQWMRTEAEKRIGHLYPKVEVTAAMARERPDLKPLVGRKLTVIAWLWARTVRSPNPAFAHVQVPLASTFMLSTKEGKEAYVLPVIEGDSYRFTVKVGKPKDAEAARSGTSAGKRAAFTCIMSDTPLTYDYIRSEGQAGRMGARLMAIVAEGDRGRIYLTPTKEAEHTAAQAIPSWKPENELPDNPRDFKTPNYGLMTFGDLFTPRQLVALTTFSDLVGEARARILADARAAGLPDDGRGLEQGGSGALAYANSVSVYLAMAVSKWTDLSNSICTWNTTNQNIRQLFSRQAIPMAWDFAELSPFSSTGSWYSTVESAVKLFASLPALSTGGATQTDAAVQTNAIDRVVSTDPPYFDNIGYADLADFFYVWLRRSLRPILPSLFATISTPKAEELVATPYRHGSTLEAEVFFLQGMTQAMHRIAKQVHPAFPVTIYYAFKQSDTDKEGGTASTGWDTFLDAVARAGFSITGTWPMRTEREARSIGIASNALASSIVLVCRPRDPGTPTATRSQFLTALKATLPKALRDLQRGGIAPVDLAQAAIGPGMAVYTQFARVIENDGSPMTVRTALALINRALDEVLAEQEGDFDSETRWAVTWFTEHGFEAGLFGEADVLARAKVTSVDGMVQAGIVRAGQGKVRLLRRDELAADWSPATDKRITIWEVTQHLIRVLENHGEAAAAALMVGAGARAEAARELAYRLYTHCERKGWAEEARAYNGLVVEWNAVHKRAGEAPAVTPTQERLI